MLNVKRSSLIYKFMDGNLLRDRDEFMPDNLCPYMRRFVRMFAVVSVVYFAVLFAALSMIVGPSLMYFIAPEILTGLLGFMVTVSVALWAIAGLVLVIGGTIWYLDEHKIVMDKFTEGAAYVGDKVRNNIFWKWYRAIHDKICPSLSFE